MTKETTGGWIEEIPTLDSIELLSNGNVRVTSSDFQDEYSIDLHPMHLRLIAEKLGLVREMSASDADTLAAARRQHADAVRAALTLKRRLLALKKRIDHLGNWLCTQSDSEHADLSYEMDYATATADICDEFCADLDDLVDVAGDGAAVLPVAPAVSRVTNALATGAVSTSENPSETQRVSSKAPKKSGAPAGGQQEELPV